MIIYAANITSRLKYAADFIGAELQVPPLDYTTDTDIYKSYDGPKINYSAERIDENELWIQPHSLLFETGIKEQTITCAVWKECTIFFKTGGDLPFDVFAAIFYLLTRYEEYLPHVKDEYGRYDYKNSIAHKAGFLNQPLINKWVDELRHMLKASFSNSQFPTSQFTFLPTYDIDEAYAYKHKSWFRRTGAAIKDLLTGRWNSFSLRRKVLSNQISDPYDTYSWMDELHRKYKLQPVYFFLVAEKNGKYDKNILPAEPALQSLIKDLASRYPVGVHPSWQSGDMPAILRSEKEIIEEASGFTVTASRQHYIRFALPDTFRWLITAGIMADFSMGYGSINGFRASVASPYYWYDLEREEETRLQLFPFCYMDANSFYEQKQTAEEALTEMCYYYEQVKNVNGLLSMIWHNNFFGTDKRFAGWKEAYEQAVTKIMQ